MIVRYGGEGFKCRLGSIGVCDSTTVCGGVSVTIVLANVRLFSQSAFTRNHRCNQTMSALCIH